MPSTQNYPGVYIEEVPISVRTIHGVATSITAWIGRALRGPVNSPTRIKTFTEFEHIFGGLWVLSALGYSVQQFFVNGGTDAWIVRVLNDTDPMVASRSQLAPLTGGGTPLILEAVSEGSWGDHLRARVERVAGTLNSAPTVQNLFSLIIKNMQFQQVEVFPNVSPDPDHPRFVGRVLEAESRWVRVHGEPPSQPPDANIAPTPGLDSFDDRQPPGVYVPVSIPGDDGQPISDAHIVGSEESKTGIYALESVDLFNLLVLPPPERHKDVAQATYEEAHRYCTRRRAMLIADSPDSTVAAAISRETTGPWTLATRNSNAAVYFPQILARDPLQHNQWTSFRPSGAVAGVFARTDAHRGVWKAPAGRDAVLKGVEDVSIPLNDSENNSLNSVGINCLRNFPGMGPTIWGSRTHAGADPLASEARYIPVRRLTLFLEESLYRGTQWAALEPNDEPLWAQIRLNVGSFLHSLFLQGAFQGNSPRDAYLVQCDRETTNQNDIARGIINIVVGFAPLKPAEFVILRIQQQAAGIAE